MIVRVPSTRIWIWTGLVEVGAGSAGVAGGARQTSRACAPLRWPRRRPPRRRQLRLRWPRQQRQRRRWARRRRRRSRRRSSWAWCTTLRRAAARTRRCGSVHVFRMPCLRGRGRFHLGPARSRVALRGLQGCAHPLPARRGVGLPMRPSAHQMFGRRGRALSVCRQAVGASGLRREGLRRRACLARRARVRRAINSRVARRDTGRRSEAGAGGAAGCRHTGGAALGGLVQRSAGG